MEEEIDIIEGDDGFPTGDAGFLEDFDADGERKCDECESENDINCHGAAVDCGWDVVGIHKYFSLVVKVIVI